MKKVPLLFFAIILVSCNRIDAEKTGLEGTKLPSFNLLLSDSSKYFNTSNIPSGKPSVLFYFGPHCPYSKAQMKEIVQNNNKLKDIQFYVFTSWPFSEMRQFYQDFQLNKFSNILTGLDYSGYFSNYFNVQGVPYTAIYGKDKKLKSVFIGNVSSNQIKNVVDN